MRYRSRAATNLIMSNHNRNVHIDENGHGPVVEKRKERTQNTITFGQLLDVKAAGNSVEQGDDRNRKRTKITRITHEQEKGNVSESQDKENKDDGKTHRVGEQVSKHTHDPLHSF